MYELCRLSTHKHLRAVGGLLACFILGLQVNAQTVSVPDAAFQRFMWTTTGANSQSVTVGTGGVPVVSPTGSGTLAADGTKSLSYSRNAAWRNGSNNPVSGSISAKVPINTKSAKILTAGMKILPWVATGAAIWDFAREIGFNPTKDDDGDLVVTKSNPALCTVAPCYRYAPLAGPSIGVFSDTPMPACEAHIGVLYGTNYTAVYSIEGTGETVACYMRYQNWDGTPLLGKFNLHSQPRSVDADIGIPSTLQELEDAIAAKSGWPSSSKIPSALRDAATATGQQIDVELPKITGPATSPGTTTTTQNPNGTTTENNTTHNHIYNDNRVTNTTTRTSSVTNNTTGATETTTTTEEPVEEPSECEKNPSSLNCSDLDTPEGEIPKVEKVISYQAEDLGFGGGSCPANVVMTPKGAAAPMTVINWTDNCQKITTYAKPMILSMALFSALMIVFVGGKPE